MFRLFGQVNSLDTIPAARSRRVNFLKKFPVATHQMPVSPLGTAPSKLSDQDYSQRCLISKIKTLHTRRNVSHSRIQNGYCYSLVNKWLNCETEVDEHLFFLERKKIIDCPDAELELIKYDVYEFLDKLNRDQPPGEDIEKDLGMKCIGKHSDMNSADTLKLSNAVDACSRSSATKHLVIMTVDCEIRHAVGFKISKLNDEYRFSYFDPNGPSGKSVKYKHAIEVANAIQESCKLIVKDKTKAAHLNIYRMQSLCKTASLTQMVPPAAATKASRKYF